MRFPNENRKYPLGLSGVQLPAAKRAEPTDFLDDRDLLSVSGRERTLSLLQCRS